MTTVEYKNSIILRWEDTEITVDEYIDMTGAEDFIITACGIPLYDSMETLYDYPKQIADAYIERVYRLNGHRIEIEI